MKAKNFLGLTGYLLIIIGCSGPIPGKKTGVDPGHVYPTVRYLDLKLGPNGNLTSNPYVLKFTNKSKTIVFCGTNHLPSGTGIGDSVFQKIIAEFDSLQPDVCINEGGNMSGKHYSSPQEAVEKNGEIGLLKFLADSLNILTENGDPSTSEEFSGLRQRFSAAEFLAYIVTERFMWAMQDKPKMPDEFLNTAYRSFINDYIIAEGKIHLSTEQQTLNYYKIAYQELVHRPFDLSTLEPTNPFDSTSRFQTIGRASKELRDQYLLRKIDTLTNRYDKVFVVFGGWHLLTCTPGLKEIIGRAGR